MGDIEIVEDILEREKGYVNDPVDKGGCTNFGITIGTLRRWRQKPVSCDDVRTMSIDEAKMIYMTWYVMPFDGVDPAVKPQVVDIAVHSGVDVARQLLEAARKPGKRSVNTQLVIERLKFFGRIIQAHPTQAKFANGWINRATAFLV